MNHKYTSQPGLVIHTVFLLICLRCTSLDENTFEELGSESICCYISDTLVENVSVPFTIIKCVRHFGTEHANDVRV